MTPPVVMSFVMCSLNVLRDDIGHWCMRCVAVTRRGQRVVVIQSKLDLKTLTASQVGPLQVHEDNAKIIFRQFGAG